jgi:hypothetical protein
MVFGSRAAAYNAYAAGNQFKTNVGSSTRPPLADRGPVLHRGRRARLTRSTSARSPGRRHAHEGAQPQEDLLPARARRPNARRGRSWAPPTGADGLGRLRVVGHRARRAARHRVRRLQGGVGRLLRRGPGRLDRGADPGQPERLDGHPGASSERRGPALHAWSCATRRPTRRSRCSRASRCPKWAKDLVHADDLVTSPACL